jgi:ribonuclease R
MTERRADDATRDVADFLKCEFMLDHVGDSFDGVIASVTNFGFFVRLNEFHIDGLVHISSLLSDYFGYDDVKQCLIGENSRRVFRLGDPVKVKVVAVNIDERKIDFLVDEPKGVNRKSSNKKSAIRKPRAAKSKTKKTAPKAQKVKRSKK